MRFNELLVNSFYYADPVLICPIFIRKDYMIAIADLEYGDGWQIWEWTSKEWNNSSFEEKAYETGDALDKYFESNQELIEILFSNKGLVK